MTISDKPKRAPLHKAKILVVDDEVLIREAITLVLEPEGYQVLTAENGNDAVELFRRYQPDLVLLDLLMPGKDGLQTCKEMREFSGSEGATIVILTQLDDPETISNAFKAGATDYIIKPIDWFLLQQRVALILQNMRLLTNFNVIDQELAQAQRIARLGILHINTLTKHIQISDISKNILDLNADDESCSIPKLLEFIHPEDRTHVEFVLNNAINEKSLYIVEYRLHNHRDEDMVILQQGEYIENIKTPGYGWLNGFLQDVTESRKIRDNLEYQNYYDILTDLPNRKSFKIQVKHCLASPPDDSLFAIVFIGLDRFSRVNDELSHAGGDKVMKTIASRLQQFENNGHIVCHHHSDVFSMLIRNIKHIEECTRTLNVILKCIREPVVIDAKDIYVTASLGVSVFPLESETDDGLIKGSEAAMLQSRYYGGNQYTYRTVEMENSCKLRRQIERDIRSAIKNEEFIPYYQPQIDTSSRQIVSAEALTRWIHPVKGLIQPDDFIPIAEETGLIIDIERQILSKVCTQLKDWIAQGYNLRVGINMAAPHIEQSDMVSFIKNILTKTEVSASALDIEITERTAVKNQLDSINKLNALRELGIKTSMDDFGTGYSSLSLLQELPLDILKVDKSFVSCIHSGLKADKGAIAAAIIAMSHSLGLQVIAEGVETEQQFAFLQDMGCHIMQGYLFGKPMPASEFEKLLPLQVSVQKAL